MEDTRLPYAASYPDESGLRGGLYIWTARRACDHRRRPKTCDQKSAPELERVGGFDQEPPRRLYWMGGVRKESASDRRQRQRKELFGARLSPPWRRASPRSFPLRQVRQEAARLLLRGRLPHPRRVDVGGGPLTACHDVRSCVYASRGAALSP